MKYAIDRKFENTKEHNVIFYDMGSTSVKSSFVTFSAYDVLDGKKNKTVGARRLRCRLFLGTALTATCVVAHRELRGEGRGVGRIPRWARFRHAHCQDDG